MKPVKLAASKSGAMLTGDLLIPRLPHTAAIHGMLMHDGESGETLGHKTVAILRQK